MVYRWFGIVSIMLLMILVVACGGGDSNEVPGITPTPELQGLSVPLMVDTDPEPVATQTPIAPITTIDPVADLFSIGELVCLQTELGGNVDAISNALEGTMVLSLQALRSLQACTGSTSIVPGEVPEFSAEQLDCLIARGDVEILQNLSPEETQSLSRAFVECGIIEFDPLAVALDPEPDPVIVESGATTIPETSDPLVDLPKFFAHSDLDCVAERAGQSTSRLIRKATDIASLEYQVGIATFCLESNSKSIPNYVDPTRVPDVTACQNAFLGVQALLDANVEHPLLLTLGLSQLNGRCEFDEVRLLVFSG